MLSPPSPHFGGCPAARQLCSPPLPPCPPPAPPPSILLARCLSQHAGAAWGPTFLLRLGFESAHSLGAPALHCQVGGGGVQLLWVGGGQGGSRWQLCVPLCHPYGTRGAAEDGPTRCTWALLSPHPWGRRFLRWHCVALPPPHPIVLCTSQRKGCPSVPPPPPKIRAGCCTPPIPTLGSHRCGVGGGFNSALLLWHLGKCIAYQCAPPLHKHTHTVWHCCDSAVGGGGGAESA